MTDNEKQIEFLEIFEPLRERLSRFVRSISYNKTEASDIYSETILRCYENFGKIRNRQAFLSYFFTVSSRLNKRRIWRNRIFGEYKEETVMQMSSKEVAPDKQLDIEILYSTMKKLPVKYQEALALFEISGFSIEEISKMQSSSITAVKSRLKRGREKLAELLKDKYTNYDDFKLQDENRAVYKHNVFELNKNIENYRVRVLND